jgi:hypothetical protein
MLQSRKHTQPNLFSNRWHSFKGLA